MAKKRQTNRARQKRRRDARNKAKTQPESQPSPPTSVTAHRGFSRRDARLILALILLVVISYLPAMLWGGFVWDDIDHIPGEPAIAEWSGIRDIWFAPTETKEPHYRPMTYTTFWLEHKLWGFAPGGYHVVNVLLHLVNTLLLWRILHRLAVPGAYLIAAIFAVHPLHVESVAWTIERKDVLSSMFYLSCILIYLRYLKTPRGWYYALALALFAGGVLAKNMVVTLPAALLILYWWQYGRISVQDLLRVLPFFAISLCFIALDLSLLDAATPAAFGYSIVERMLIASRAFWFYVGKLLCPVDLVVIYPHWDNQLGTPLAWDGAVIAATWGGLVAIAALVGTLWFLRHRIGRGPLAGVLFFGVTLSPALGFVEHTYMLFSFVADRYQYLAGIGVIAVVTGAATNAAGRLPSVWRKGAMGIAIAVLLILGTLTWRQSAIYKDQETFFRYIVTHNPQAPGAYLNLGNALLAQGRLQEALAATRVAVEQDTLTFDAYGNLIQILIALGRADEALSTAHKGLEKFPDHANAPAHVGLALFHLGQIDEAEPYFARALKINPRYGDALLGLAVVQINQKRYAESLAHLNTLIEIAPGNVQAWANRGLALQALHKTDEALKSFDRALAIDPNMPTARAGREQVLREMK